MVNSYGVHTWNGQPSPYWQHNTPIVCPKHHVMGWLGSRFWLCSTCQTIYVETVAPPLAAKDEDSAYTDLKS